MGKFFCFCFLTLTRLTQLYLPTVTECGLFQEGWPDWLQLSIPSYTVHTTKAHIWLGADQMIRGDGAFFFSVQTFFFTPNQRQSVFFSQAKAQAIFFTPLSLIYPIFLPCSFVNKLVIFYILLNPPPKKNNPLPHVSSARSLRTPLIGLASKTVYRSNILRYRI